jgi:hypothetical protein
VTVYLIVGAVGVALVLFVARDAGRNAHKLNTVYLFAPKYGQWNYAPAGQIGAQPLPMSPYSTPAS